MVGGIRLGVMIWDERTARYMNQLKHSNLKDERHHLKMCPTHESFLVWTPNSAFELDGIKV